MDNEILNSLIISYKLYLSDGNIENSLLLAKALAEYGLVNDGVKYLLEYFEKGGKPEKAAEIISIFPEEIRASVKEITKPSMEEFDAQSYLEMADLLWDIGSPEDAKQNYIRAIESYAIKGEMEKAKNRLEKVKEKYPDDKEVKSINIESLRIPSLSWLKEINIPILPADEENLRLNLAKSLINEGLLDLGIEELNKVISLHGEYVIDAVKEMIPALISQEKYSKALNLIDNYLSGEERLNKIYNIAELLEQNGRTEDATNLYNRIFLINPDFKEVKKKLSPVVESPSEIGKNEQPEYEEVKAKKSQRKSEKTISKMGKKKSRGLTKEPAKTKIEEDDIIFL